MSLFPVLLQPSSGSNDTAAGDWLQNSSFTADAGALNNAVPSPNQQIQLEDSSSSSGEDERAHKNRVKVSGPQYELVINSSASDRGSHSDDGDDDEETGKRRRNKNRRKKKKKRKMESSSATHLFPRKPDSQIWASSSTTSSTNNAKDYYFDSRGDRDNLAFGSLYRMDVARYNLHNTKKTSDFSSHRLGHRNSVFDGDQDLQGLDSKLRLGGRYWSAQYAALERNRNLKRIRVFPPEEKNVSRRTCSDFISLLDDGESDHLGANFVEESWEDEPQKGARSQTLEKKISILEKAAELNPENEDLLLSLLKAYQGRDGTDVLISRWEKVLVQNPGSYRLWRKFLRVVQGEFSRFKVSEMRKFYANAVRALSGECSKMYAQVHRDTSNQYLLDLELGLVDISLCLCRFEWQAGYRELATALFQAEIEYSLFCPSLLLSEQSKRRLFEHFWNSNGARVGEDGALGWATWLAKEEEQRAKFRSEELSHEVEGGGWTGWSEMPSKTQEGREILENGVADDMVVEDFDDVLPTKEDENDDDTETLLNELRIVAAADANIDANDVNTWTSWSKEELARDCNQWMPVRAEITAAASAHGGDAKDDEQLLRVIVYDDVADYVFSLISEKARLSLVSQFIEFFGGRISQWACSNTFPQNYILEEAVLISEELSKSEMKSSQPHVTPCRSLAKSLLKQNRQDILICGAYAQREAAYGNLDRAREIFDMALSSIEQPPKDVQSNVSLLYLWYAEMEIANKSVDNSESSSRAMHILSCSGCGVKYNPYRSRPSNLQQLRARQGFKEQIRMLSSQWACGRIDDSSCALIYSAALFEELTTGPAAAIEILEEVLSMVLPERRRHSHQLEVLFNYYLKILCQYHQEMMFGNTWEAISKGLQMYPLNPHLYATLAEFTHIHTSPNKMRWILDEYVGKKSSLVACFFS
ncbi:OLC1v1009681C1 [Oldenlandia corymbosa var. corymbosa]|uniref:OLC1v1009681C1 n=1 Tax=Oldenlandia corymbosa var. corymbosa TaxID=529605 RepID=A0AAV1DPH9_OLDCO|nr:OLC1v1009681C1 [Oldenlandia corymbosa var. corymbosa]